MSEQSEAHHDDRLTLRLLIAAVEEPAAQNEHVERFSVNKQIRNTFLRRPKPGLDYVPLQDCTGILLHHRSVTYQ